MKKGSETNKYSQPESKAVTPQNPTPADNSSLAGLKEQIVKQFGVLFGSDSQFVVSKAFSVVFRGIRFSLERKPNEPVTTKIVPISKRGGLLKPGYLEGKATPTGRVINNLLTSKPALNLVRKDKTYLVHNAECHDVLIGSIHVSQENGSRRISFQQDNKEIGSIKFVFNQPRSGWCCAARAPPGLFNIGMATDFKSHKFQVDENPNGDDCRTTFEANFEYASGATTPSLTEFLALISLLEVAAVELS